MYKTIEAYYKDGKITYKEKMPPVKKAKLLITIIDDEPKTQDLSVFSGILKDKKIDGIEYQEKLRNEWK